MADIAKQAVVIGANKYPNYHDANLAYCVADAKLRNAWLNKRGFTVTMLLDANVTPATVKAAVIAGLKAAAGGWFVWSYAGHGGYNYVWNAVKKRWQSHENLAFPGGALWGWEVGDLLLKNRPPDVNVLLLFDCCYSGRLYMAPKATKASNRHETDTKRSRVAHPWQAPWGTVTQAQAAGIKPVIDKAASFATILPQLEGVAYLGACNVSQESFEDSLIGHGAFTYYSDPLLRQPGATANKVAAGIRPSLPSPKYPQNPSLAGDKEVRKKVLFK